MKPGAIGALVMAGMLLACSGSRAPRDATGERSATGDTVAQAPGTAAADPPALPPIEQSCAVDADCALVDLGLECDQRCCPQCAPVAAGRADGLARVPDVCKAHPEWTRPCLPLNCPEGVERAVCKDGRCVIAS